MARRHTIVLVALLGAVGLLTTGGALALGASVAGALPSWNQGRDSVSVASFGETQEGWGASHLATNPSNPRIAPLTDRLRQKGFHECNPPDPIGVGPYAPYTRIRMGRMLIPNKGGHTADMGFDVVVHFHGHEPARKYLVQAARGVAFVGIDFGNGSGRYAKPFRQQAIFPALKRSIERALKRHTGDDRAHVRRLGLSSWSAGYGAINEIVRHHADDVDAVVLLDGLHGGWKRKGVHKDDVRHANAGEVKPLFDFARRAVDGNKIFVFTHTQTRSTSYPSTKLTGDVLLADLGMVRTPVDSKKDRLGLASTVDVRGFHVWSYQGRNEAAHCSHLKHVGKIVRDVLEPAWQTPAMDRNVVTAFR